MRVVRMTVIATRSSEIGSGMDVRMEYVSGRLNWASELGILFWGGCSLRKGMLPIEVSERRKGDLVMMCDGYTQKSTAAVLDFTANLKGKIRVHQDTRPVWQ